MFFEGEGGEHNSNGRFEYLTENAMNMANLALKQSTSKLEGSITVAEPQKHYKTNHNVYQKKAPAGSTEC